MMNPRVVARPLARALWAALIATAAITAPAAAWEYPLLPHVNSLAFFPETPNSESNTFAYLSAYYPGECWRVVDSTLVDSAHVRVTIRRSNDCPGTDSLSYWTRLFNLGVLAGGMHELTVHCTVLDADLPPAEEEITVPFEVASGPPPPPPPPPNWTPLLEQIQVTGAEPGHSVTLTINGFKPFECTFIHDDHVVDQTRVEVSFDWQATCADTARRWSRSFDMGVYPLGYHEILIHLSVMRGDSATTEDHVAAFRVRDPNEPPPVDSVTITVNSLVYEPANPTSEDPITLHVSGSYPPYFCGEYVQSGRFGDTIELVMRPDRDCTDTVRAFAHSIALGTLPAGDYAFTLETIWQLWGGSIAPRYWPAPLHVRGDSIPPPPPPGPPDDSLHTTLSSSKPNPFRDQTQFAVSLADPTEATVAVYDLAGRLVNTIHRGTLPRGTTFLAWNGRRQNGARAPQGIYFYQLTLPGRVVHRRVVLLDGP